ncbi:MAG: zinc-dependent metalloprotease [Armatimonadetes bacterium]|nr:zinc-dependent metalloprotease [Armatimonadota bacterium]
MNSYRVSSIFCLALSLILAVSPVHAQNRRAGPGAGGGGEFGPGQTSRPEEYGTAIKDFAKQDGVFTVFTKDESIYFEIPKNMFGRDFLISSELAQSPAGGYNGSAARSTVIRWELRGEKILLRSIDYAARATGSDALSMAVADSNIDPIIQVFDIKSKNPDGNGIVVDVSRMFKQEITELSVRNQLGGGSPDPTRTFIERVVAFPENINVEVLMTFTGAQQPATTPGGGGGGFRRAPSRSSNTALVHHSIVLLPEKPMMGRLADSRVGYFSSPFTEYNTGHHTEEKAFIDRYRLEKKDPSAAVSEPVKPIVYYISREVPEKWRSYIAQGIEDWQSAFEKAGFKKAIVAKVAPTKQEDPKWSPEDVRYSVIRWAPLPVANAMGPHTSDPRSGEILSAHVIVWHDVLKLAETWYFTQASPNDKRSQKLPIPDDVLGECLRFVVSHEVGHTLGLPHNGKSSGMIPVELLRDPKWTDENGTCTSIMDYARFNYVAQPGDNARLMPRIGTYDDFSIRWGYTPIPEARNPESEKPTLDKWAAVQVDNPMLRFYDNFADSDPSAQSEALGDDAVKASDYGVQNLKRVVDYLVPASTKLGEDYDELRSAYNAVWGQLGEYSGHVITMVGGVVESDYHAGRGGEVYVDVPKDRQKAAVQWLGANVLATPEWLLRRDIISNISNSGYGNRLLGLQNQVFNGLLSTARIGRILQNEWKNGSSAYSAAEMMDDLRGSVWSELKSANPVISGPRRAMQRAYVQALISKLVVGNSDVRTFVVRDLQLQKEALDKARRGTKDRVTQAHMIDLALQIDQALKFPPQAPAEAPAQQGFGRRPDGIIEWYPCDLWTHAPGDKN